MFQSRPSASGEVGGKSLVVKGQNPQWVHADARAARLQGHLPLLGIVIGLKCSDGEGGDLLCTK